MRVFRVMFMCRAILTISAIPLKLKVHGISLAGTLDCTCNTQSYGGTVSEAEAIDARGKQMHKHVHMRSAR